MQPGDQQQWSGTKEAKCKNTLKKISVGQLEVSKHLCSPLQVHVVQNLFTVPLLVPQY